MLSEITLPLGTNSLIRKSFTELLKKHFNETEEAIAQMLLAELKSGLISLENIAKENVFIGGYYRIVDAALKGATNRSLRLMCQILRAGIETNITRDEINTVLSLAAELSEEEVSILAQLWKCKQEEEFDNSINAHKRLKDKLVPAIYSEDYLDALLGRLLRTGLIIAKSGWGGLIMQPSPLLDKFIALAKLQIHNNS